MNFTMTVYSKTAMEIRTDSKPIDITICNGFIENAMIPSDTNLIIFFNGYFVLPAKRSSRSYSTYI